MKATNCWNVIVICEEISYDIMNDIFIGIGIGIGIDIGPLLSKLT